MAFRIDPAVRRSSLAIRSTLERLRRQVIQSKRRPVPGNHPGPTLWLALIEGLIDTAELYLDNITAKKFGDSPAHILREAARLTRRSYLELTRMSGAGLEDIPYPLVQPLQRWFDQLNISNTIIFRAALNDNYEILTLKKDWFIEGARIKSKSLERAIADISWDIKRVTIPSKAFSYLPHMAIVAHEIGHVIYNRIPWDMSEFKNSDKSGIKAAITARLTKFDHKTSELLIEISQKWHEEIAADAASFFLVGPAAFFAFSESVGYMGDALGLSATHPPNFLRRHFLYEALEKGGNKSFKAFFEKHTESTLSEDFNSALLPHLPNADEIFELYFRTKKYDYREAAIFAELSIRLHLVVPSIYGSVSKFLQEHHPDAIYSPEQLDRDLTKHLTSLLRAVPPIEEGADLSEISLRVDPGTDDGRAAEQSLDDHLKSSTPVGFPSILNVGWAAILTKHAELRVKITDAYNADCQKLDQLHNLLLKGIELSEAFRSWRSGDKGRQNRGKGHGDTLRIGNP